MTKGGQEEEEVKQQGETTEAKGVSKKRQEKAKQKEADKIKKAVTVPNTESRGHTGYLTFATKF